MDLKCKIQFRSKFMNMCWLTILYSILHIPSYDNTMLIKKRQILHSPPIIYPYGGTFKLIVGFAIPINMPSRTLVYGQNFQFQYALPQNTSIFTDNFSSTLQRQRRTLMSRDRSSIYRLLEQEWRRRGVGGLDCMKRSICESAWMALKDEGLLGELLHVLLTPNYGGKLFVDEDYLKAMEAGRRGDDCLQIYHTCPKGYGILDLI